jgi:hypothetical protein
VELSIPVLMLMAALLRRGRGSQLGLVILDPTIGADSVRASRVPKPRYHMTS